MNGPKRLTRAQRNRARFTRIDLEQERLQLEAFQKQHALWDRVMDERRQRGLTDGELLDKEMLTTEEILFMRAWQKKVKNLRNLKLLPRLVKPLVKSDGRVTDGDLFLLYDAWNKTRSPSKEHLDNFPCSLSKRDMNFIKLHEAWQRERGGK